MNETTRRHVSDVVLLLGLLLFVLGAAVVVLDYRLGVPVAVVGALALLFVGVGVSMKRDARPPTT